VEDAVKRWVILVVVLAMTHVARADDAACLEVAKGRLRTAPAVPTVIFFSKPAGKPRGTQIKGDSTTLMAGDVVYFFAKADTPIPADLGLCADTKIDLKFVDRSPKCKGGLFTFNYTRTCDAAAPPPAPAPPASQAPPPVPGDMVADILKRADAPDSKKMIENAGGATIAAEVVQILGQIVADRASAAAYGLLTDKAKVWLKCSDKEPLFESTCELIKTLRLQDLAMAPDQLRGTLTQDALRYVKKKTRGVVSITAAASSAIHVVLAPQASQPSPPQPADDGCAPANKDIRCAISRYLENHIIPAIAKPIDALTGHSSQAMVQTLIADGLAKLQANTVAELCGLKPREQILATVAVAFTKCKLDQSTDCAIMQVVDTINNQCTDTAEKLDDYQVGYARSLAGHLWEAATLKKDTSASDEPKRLVAGLEASFEVACMYANAAAGPYECKLLPKHGDPLEPSEAVAVTHDVVIAAANRDGGGIAAAFVRFLVRILPADDDVTQRKGLRILSTISAYAATYFSSEKGSEDAHDRRTALLESLTRDMTQRSDRGGDAIWSLGGSLRGVLGGRLGRGYETSSGDKYGTALWAPLSLPLGFAYDSLWETDDNKRRGLHLEFGVIDLAQYLSWEEGFKISEPNVEDALTPSFTLSYAFGWELPMFLGVTVGYTPSFDFNSDSENDKRGSWNIGGTLGFYVPLLDLN
jgi:hypothetical protein